MGLNLYAGGTGGGVLCVSHLGLSDFGTVVFSLNRV
jgi:hypothetical protein